MPPSLHYVARLVNTACADFDATVVLVMTPDDKRRKQQGARLATAREGAGFRSARAAALGLGWPESSYRAHEAGTRTIGQDDAERYAARFRSYGVKVTARSILFGGPDELSTPLTAGLEPAGRVNGIHIRGEVAANRWLADDEFMDNDLPLVPTVPGRFPTLDQFSYRVVGPCMDLKKILNGDFVICVNYFEARTAITDGDVVVVERRRGQLVERTCKELKVVNGGFELWPRSSSPKFQEPIVVANKKDRSEEDGTTVEVVGLVIGRFSPM